MTARWHSVRVYYYDEDKTGLILGGVRPLFADVAGDVEAAFYLRHWRQGPHLRLVFRTDAGRFRERVVPAVRETVGGRLRERPSTSRLDPYRHIGAHRRLAEEESEPGPLLPWRPDNSIHVAEHDSRAHVLGRDGADLLAGFYAATTGLSFRMTERCPDRRGRAAAAFDLMIATAHALSGMELRRGFVSFRSHAESFLSGHRDGRALRSAWQEHYRRHASQLAARVGAVVTAVDEGADEPCFAAEWATELGRHRDRAARLIELGGTGMEWAAPREPGPSPLAEVSPFHRALEESPEWPELRASAGFTLYRLMLNYTYLHLTRLGLTPAERYLLCHLAADAAEERYGVTATDLIGRAR